MDDFTALAAARTALESRDWQEAARLYTSVLEHGRSQAEALHGLGVVALLGRRDAKTARSLFEAAVARAPNDANSLYRLGEIAETESDRDAALERYRQVLALAPNHAAARSRLGALAQPAHTPQAAAPDTPETHAASGTSPGPPRAPKYPDSYVGVARNVHGTPAGFLRNPLLTFTLDLGPAGTVPVVLKGQAIRGALRNGEWVEIHKGDAKKRASTLEIKELLNLSTGEPVFRAMSTAMRRGLRRQMGAPIPQSYVGYRRRFTGESPRSRKRAAPNSTTHRSGAPPSHPTAPAANAQPSKRLRSRATTAPKWKIAFAALAISAAAGTLYLVFAKQQTSNGADPAATVRDYWNLLERRDYANAFNDFTPHEQQRLGGIGTFANAHATNPLQSESVKLRPRPVNAGTATVDIVTLKTIGTRSGCQTWEGSYQLLQSRGRWLIDDARITPTSC